MSCVAVASARRAPRPLPAPGRIDRFRNKKGDILIFVGDAARWVNAKLRHFKRDSGEPFTVTSGVFYSDYCAKDGRGVVLLGRKPFETTRDLVQRITRTNRPMVFERQYVKKSELRRVVAKVKELYAAERVPLEKRQKLTLDELTGSEFREYGADFVRDYRQIPHPDLGRVITAPTREPRLDPTGRPYLAEVYGRDDFQTVREKSKANGDAPTVTPTEAETRTGIGRRLWCRWTRGCPFRDEGKAIDASKPTPLYADAQRRARAGGKDKKSKRVYRIGPETPARCRGTHFQSRMPVQQVDEVALRYRFCQKLVREKKDGLYAKDGRVFRSPYAARRDYGHARFTTPYFLALRQAGEIKAEDYVQVTIPNRRAGRAGRRGTWSKALPRRVYVYSDTVLTRLAGHPPRRGAVIRAAEVPEWPPKAAPAKDGSDHDAGNGHAAPAGTSIEPAVLDQSVEPDGPRPGDVLYWKGDPYPLRPRCWQVLKALWNTPALPIEDVITDVWGANSDASDRVLRTVVSRLTTALLNVPNFPWSFCVKSGQVLKIPRK